MSTILSMLLLSVLAVLLVHRVRVLVESLYSWRVQRAEGRLVELLGLAAGLWLDLGCAGLSWIVAHVLGGTR
jgi:hypothetical protein